MAHEVLVDLIGTSSISDRHRHLVALRLLVLVVQCTYWVEGDLMVMIMIACCIGIGSHRMWVGINI